MIKVDVSFLPSLVKETQSSVVVTVDTLRATSSITTLVDRGCKAVIPVCGNDDAFKLKDSLTKFVSNRVLLCGEDTIGKIITKFDLYNSPLKLSKLQFFDEIVIIKSTSGTKMLNSLRTAPCLLVGCILNATACAEVAIKQVEQLGLESIQIICSGSHNNEQIAIEDVIGAGLILRRITENRTVILEDTSKITLSFLDDITRKEPLLETLRNSETGKRIQQAGEAEDIDFCGQVDVMQKVPVRVKSPIGETEFVVLGYE